MKLTHHTLRINNPDITIPFYEKKLGMILLGKISKNDKFHYFLSYVDPNDVERLRKENTIHPWEGENCFLELVYDQLNYHDTSKQHEHEGYWKIAISIKDLDIARNRLISNGVDVKEAFQVPDVAYLCHLKDPEGYTIELIQHSFLHHHQPEPANNNFILGNSPTFLLITYRIKDPIRSLLFYREIMKMRLLSKQVLESRGFTLYFLACTDEVPPSLDIEDIPMREWLWRRPYILLELQHIWGTEDDNGFAYRTGGESGFEGISFTKDNITDILEKITEKGEKIIDPILSDNIALIHDPDGYPIRLIEKSKNF